MLTRRWKSAGAARTIWALLAIAVLTCLASTGFAQTTTTSGSGWDAYYVGYFGNANAGMPNAEINIVNPGSTGGFSEFDSQGGPFGDLCANIYVFTSDQEMVECCSCFISPNGLRTLSLDTDLTSNPLANVGTVPPPHGGLIKIVSSAVNNDLSDVCSTSFTNPAGAVKTIDVAATAYYPYGSLRTWNTHSRQTVAGSLFTVTETAFRREDLGFSTELWDSTELLKLQQQCNFRQTNGSGHGRCTCGVGD